LCDRAGALITAICFTLPFTLYPLYSSLVFFFVSTFHRDWIGEGGGKDEQCLFLPPTPPPSHSFVLFATSKTHRCGQSAHCWIGVWGDRGADVGILGGCSCCIDHNNDADNIRRRGAVSLCRPLEVSTMVTATAIRRISSSHLSAGCGYVHLNRPTTQYSCCTSILLAPLLSALSCTGQGIFISVRDAAPTGRTAPKTAATRACSN
jgi:hypothetical protein